jgi:hypothetical protein
MVAGPAREAAMVRKATMTAVLAAVLGLGVLAGVGVAIPWQDWSQARQERRMADSARAEELFALRYRMYAQGGWRPAQPLALCEACISAAVNQGLDQAAARANCGTACGVD